MKIEPTVKEHLNTYELSQLEKFLETLEMQFLYLSGLEKFMGSYAEAEAYDILQGEEYDEAKGLDVDVIEIEVEVGEHTESMTKCTKTCHKITRNILTDPNISIKEMLEKLQEA